jgi:acyl carrier protein
MTDHRSIVRAAIAQVAPDVDVEALADDAPFRVEADLDSMDYLNILTAIAAKTGVDIPESDDPSDSTIGALADYLDAHAARSGRDSPN